jgi:tellurite resistance protein
MPKLLEYSIEECDAKIKDFGAIVAEIKLLNKDAIESIIASAEFIMHADGKVDPREQAVINEIRNCI